MTRRLVFCEGPDDLNALRAIAQHLHWAGPVRTVGQAGAGQEPDHRNLERLLCAVLAKAYPDDTARVSRWLTEVGAARNVAHRKPATWKAAIHVWLAAVYEKVDELNAATRFLYQQAECKPHVEATLAEVGLVADLRPLLAPP